MARIKFNVEGLNFDLKGKEVDPFGNEKIKFDLVGQVGKLEFEAEASIEEMVRDVIPYLKDAIKASIEKK